MKKQTLYILLSVMYMLGTTAAIILGFFFFTPTKTHLVGICALSFIGYTAAYEYHLLGNNKTDGDYSFHLIGLLILIVLIMSL